MGANGRSDAAANLTYTKFLFVLPHADDAASLTKIRGAIRGDNVETYPRFAAKLTAS